MREVLINTADWDGPDDLPDDAVIVNAPRPLTGVITWTGEFRHGVFYAAAPLVPGSSVDPFEYFGWRRDDASRVVFITDGQIRERVAAHVTERGYYGSLEAMTADGITVAEVAYGMELPYRGEDECAICPPTQCPGPQCPGSLS